MSTPHVCPKCKAEKPAVAICHPCKGTGILWEPPASDEAFTKLADAIGKLLPVTPQVVPMPYPVYPGPSLPDYPVYPVCPPYVTWGTGTGPMTLGDLHVTGISTLGACHGQA